MGTRDKAWHLIAGMWWLEVPQGWMFQPDQQFDSWVEGMRVIWSNICDTAEELHAWLQSYKTTFGCPWSYQSPKIITYFFPPVVCDSAACRRRPSPSRQARSFCTSTSAPLLLCRTVSAMSASPQTRTGTNWSGSIHGYWLRWAKEGTQLASF